ncbi:hypothetical protein L211DRAFT_588121 [Terfezia boudieri ATCC MYA-4762]|uniref:Uncharacterized protein n=1 Tax=Terfezia boudieri ATCC MYA-4762 TaxID=1051890 RepID=A0A3N4LPG9_9PEZI|nr:hypothetical protein L211DRAFT_588121 [Terfezia boudieri ATCC MYA-4762]
MLLRSMSKGKGHWGSWSSWSLRGRSQPKEAEHDEMPSDSAAIIKMHNSPYMNHPYNQAEVSTSILRVMPAITKTSRKAVKRHSGGCDKSITGAPALEAMCDSLFEPSKRLSLRLDFEPEVKTAPTYPMQPLPASPLDSPQHIPPSTAPPQSPKSRHSKASSGKRILRNIPMINGGFWRSVPKIKFVRKFEETSN